MEAKARWMARIAETRPIIGIKLANALYNDGFEEKTVGELRRVSDEEIIRIPNVGRKTLQYLRDLIGYPPDMKERLCDLGGMKSYGLTAEMRKALSGRALALAMLECVPGCKCPYCVERWVAD